MGFQEATDATNGITAFGFGDENMVAATGHAQAVRESGPCRCRGDSR
jgi:hypothetical protein